MTEISVQSDGGIKWACPARCAGPCLGMCSAGAPSGPVALGVVTSSMYLANQFTS